MPIRLHSQATTTPKVWAAIQASDEVGTVLAARFGLTPQTICKWRKRDSLEDRSQTPHRLQSGSDQKTIRGAVEEAVSRRCSGWSGCAIFDDRTDQQHQGCRQLLEVHCDDGQQGLDLHVFEPPPDGSCKAVERLGRPTSSFDLPSVTGVDRAFVIPPRGSFAASPKNGCVVCHDVLPAGWGASRQTMLSLSVV